MKSHPREGPDLPVKSQMQDQFGPDCCKISNFLSFAICSPPLETGSHKAHAGLELLLPLPRKAAISDLNTLLGDFLKNLTMSINFSNFRVIEELGHQFRFLTRSGSLTVSLFYSRNTGSQPVGHDPSGGGAALSWGHISDVYIMIHNSSKWLGSPHMDSC